MDCTNPQTGSFDPDDEICKKCESYQMCYDFYIQDEQSKIVDGEKKNETAADEVTTKIVDKIISMDFIVAILNDILDTVKRIEQQNINILTKLGATNDRRNT